MSKRAHISLLFLLFLLPGFMNRLAAQQDSTKLNQEVEVVKAYRPSVSNAQKINLLPEIGDTTRFRPDLNYGIISHPVTTGFNSSQVKAYDQFQREISIPGYGKISGGFGSYLTPFLDFYLSNPNSQNGSLGIQLNHLSSQGRINLKGGGSTDAPFSYNRAIFFGSYVYEGVTISSELSYQRDMNRFYGYPIAVPATLSGNNFAKYFNTDQLNQSGYFDLSLKSNASSVAAMTVNTGINLGYFNTSTGQVEKAIRLRGDFDYDFGTFKGKLKAGIEHLETDQVTDQPDLAVLNPYTSTWIVLRPSISYQSDHFTLEGGLNLYTVFDKINGNSFKPYPAAKLSIHALDNKLTLYAGLDGYLQNNDYTRIVEENRWVNPTLTVKPTNHLNVFSGGVKGKIALPLAFDFGLRYSKTEDQYFYVTRVENNYASSSSTALNYNNAFEVIYDNLNTVDFSGDLTYTTSKLFLLLSGHFYSYQLSALEKAPYLPDFTLRGATEFAVTDKIRATAELFLTGPRNVMLKFYLPLSASSTLPAPIYLQTAAMTSVNIGAKYLFTKRLSFFGKVENLLNQMNESWYGYTEQGLRFKVGGSFSF